jgi:hypothetical protein
MKRSKIMDYASELAVEFYRRNETMKKILKHCPENVDVSEKYNEADVHGYLFTMVNTGVSQWVAKGNVVKFLDTLNDLQDGPIDIGSKY